MAELMRAQREEGEAEDARHGKARAADRAPEGWSAPSRWSGAARTGKAETQSWASPLGAPKVPYAPWGDSDDDSEPVDDYSGGLGTPTGRQLMSTVGHWGGRPRRFLLTLVREGYAVADGKLFDLTPQVLELGFSVVSSMGVWDIARPFMERLSDQIEESCSAAVLDGLDVVYVSAVQYHRVITVGVAVGNRLPAYCQAVRPASKPSQKRHPPNSTTMRPASGTPAAVTDGALMARSTFPSPSKSPLVKAAPK